MEVKFSGDTADAVNTQIKDYVSKLKGTRGGKAGGDDDNAPAQAATGSAPAPIMPPQGGQPNFGGAGLAPPAGGAAQMGGAFPAAGVSGPAPEVLALVQRINNRIDWSLQPVAQNGGGQPLEGVLNWFRSQCAASGIDASSYTLDQIKQVALPRMPMPALTTIAGLMNA